MKTAFLFILPFLITVCNAQVTYVWRGDEANRTNAWDCPENWNLKRIPGPDAYVVIPDSHSNPNSYPVIGTPGCIVNTVHIAPNARITITNGGSLTILNPDYCDDVSRIKVFGKLELPGTSVERQEVRFANFRTF